MQMSPSRFSLLVCGLILFSGDLLANTPKAEVTDTANLGHGEISRAQQELIRERIDFLNNLFSRPEVQDTNNDGRIDRWHTFAGKNRVLVETDSDLNFDGKIDQKEFYVSGGEMTKKLIDRNYDGIIDQWEFPRSVGGLVYLIRMDDDFDGRVDKVVRQYYFKQKGAYTTYRVDRDFNGSFDYFGREDARVSPERVFPVK